MNDKVMTKIHTVLTSAVMWLSVLAFTIANAIPIVTDLIGVDHPVTNIFAQFVLVLGIAITIIRRVSPVAGEFHSLTPMNVSPTGKVEIVVVRTFQHHGTKYLAGEVHFVDAADAGYFTGVGWAKLAHTKIEPHDMIIHTTGETK